MSTVSWIMRIVDEDFPRKFRNIIVQQINSVRAAPGRGGKILKPNSDAYAVLAAALSQSTILCGDAGLGFMSLYSYLSVP
jgi:hypothetical protein